MPSAQNAPRLLVVGAGSRGTGYAEAVTKHTNAVIAAVADPVALKRRELGSRYIWSSSPPAEGADFERWQDFVSYERSRRERQAAGEAVAPGVTGAFVCVLDDQHREVVEALAALGLHIMCEKPLATTLQDCLRIRAALRPKGREQERVFAIGHVLRYSPHNMLLRDLVLAQQAVGEVLSVEHTEPVGFWHFAHSFVRGNWRKESFTAPSLLTKSCHDIDWLLWMLSSPLDPREAPHLPSTVSSSGQVTYFKKSRKPAAAGNATNCLSCPIEPSCIYSAKRLYVDRFLRGHKSTGWPVKIVNPEIEECWNTSGPEQAEAKLLDSLREDYGPDTPESQVEARPWFGRCVWETDNDVCDDQTVSLTWDEEPGRGAKNATLHMVAWTKATCERRGRIYGTLGEIEYDSFEIKVHSFETGETTTHHPKQEGGGHGGGDTGLTRQFVRAIEAVDLEGVSVAEAQAAHVGCSLDDVVRSHALVFAAEDARRGKKVVDWGQWWKSNVEDWKP